MSLRRYDGFIVFDTIKRYEDRIPSHYDVLTDLIHNCCMIARDVSITAGFPFKFSFFFTNRNQSYMNGETLYGQIFVKFLAMKLNTSSFYGHSTFIICQWSDCITSNEINRRHTRSNFVLKMKFVCSNSKHKLILHQ